VLPRRFVTRQGEWRYRAGPVDRRLVGIRARRHGQRYDRTWKGLPLQGKPAAHRGRTRSRQLSQRLFDPGLRVVERLRRRVVVDVGEPEVGQVVGREDVHMQVGHLEPGDDDPRTFGAERLADRLADQLRDLYDAAEHG